jgi:hypothetical protein
MTPDSIPPYRPEVRSSHLGPAKTNAFVAKEEGMKRAQRIVKLVAAVAALGLFALGEVAPAQDLHPSRRPSPMGMARTTLEDGTYVRIVYGRPYIRGREIFGTQEAGALVPYGQLWRTGANEATEITVTHDVQVAGQRLPAGTYSLFTTPGPEEWTIHFNSALGLSGTARFNPETRQFERGYDPENDVLVVSARVSALEEAVDQLTIAFEPAESGAHMALRWETTEVRVPVAPGGE